MGLMRGDKTIVSYLLGRLPEEEQVRLEQEYFSDAELFQQFVVVEDQLIDDYLRDQLSKRDRRLFEEHFLSSPRRAERVELARHLIKAVSGPPADGAPANAVSYSVLNSPRPHLSKGLRSLNPVAGFSLALVLLLMIAGGAWLLVQNASLKDQIEQLHARQALQAERERELEQQLADATGRKTDPVEQDQSDAADTTPKTQKDGRPAPALVLPLVLKPGLARGGGSANRFEIPRQNRMLQIQAVFQTDAEHATYKVEIRTAEGKRILTRGRLLANSNGSARAVILNLQSSMLPEGAYVLTLSGVSASGEIHPLEDYAFTVIKR